MTEIEDVAKEEEKKKEKEKMKLIYMCLAGGRAPQVSIASPDLKKIARIGSRATFIGNSSSRGVGKYFSLFWAFFSFVVFFPPSFFPHTHTNGGGERSIFSFPHLRGL